MYERALPHKRAMGANGEHLRSSMYTNSNPEVAEKAVEGFLPFVKARS